MLFEVKRTCTFSQCPSCGGKVFRYLLVGTYQSEEYGTSSGLKVRDRCEEQHCKRIVGETETALHSPVLQEVIEELFFDWGQRLISDEDFVKEIQILFESAGGWILRPSEKTA